MNTVHKSLFVYIIFVGLLMTFLIPPFQKPDEDRHFLRALMISNGDIGCSGKPLTQVITDHDTTQFYSKYGQYADVNSQNARKYSLAMFQNIELKDQKAAYAEPINFQTKYCLLYFAPAYVPAAVGIRISTMLGFNAQTTYYFGRLASTFAFLALFYCIYRLADQNTRNILLFVAALPMTLHQISGYSHDGFLILLGLTLFTLLTLKRHNFYAISGIMLLIFMTKKGGYELLSLFVFLIPLSQIARSKLIYILKIAGFFILVVALFIWQKQSIRQLYTDPAYNISAITNTNQQLSYMLNNPESAAAAILRTSIIFLPEYTMSIVGKLGHYDYDLNPIIYIAYVIWFLWLVSKPAEHTFLKVTFKKRILIAIILIASYLYILTLSYLIETPVGMWIAIGAQGRFFIIFVPFVLLIASGKKRYRYDFSRYRAVIQNYALPVVLALLYLLLVQVIFTKYYIIYIIKM